MQKRHSHKLVGFLAGLFLWALTPLQAETLMFPMSQSRSDAGFSGALEWSFPIDVPRGTNGLQPQLAVNYSSAFEGSTLGKGFSLSGLSRIDPHPTLANTYMLDGQRLYRDANNNFHTERESYDLIQVFNETTGQQTGDPKSGNCYWVVKKKDGTVLLYGTTNPSRGIYGPIGPAPGNSVACSWAITQVSDPSGNFESFDYALLVSKNTSSSYTTLVIPAGIAYTRNSNSGKDMDRWNYVRLYYETLTLSYPVPVVMSGEVVGTISQSYMRVQLGGIDVFTDVDSPSISTSQSKRLLKSYKFTYREVPSEGTFLLNSIQQFGNDSTFPATKQVLSVFTPSGSSVPATFFDWTADSQSVSKIRLPQGGSVSAGYISVGTPGPAQTVLSSLTTSDGLSGTSPMTATFSYNGAAYEPGQTQKRSTLGFAEVTKSTGPTGAITKTRYLTTGPFWGISSGSSVSDPSSRLLVDTAVTYEDRAVAGTPAEVRYVYPRSQFTRNWDGQTTSIDSKKTFAYDFDDAGITDVRGNLTETNDWGILNGDGSTNPLRLVKEKYAYASSSVPGVFLYRLIRKQVYSPNDSGTQGLASQTSYYYDSPPTQSAFSRGLLTKSEALVSTVPGETPLVSTMKYDDWGNLTDTWNAVGSLTSHLTYDDITHSRVTSTTNALGATWKTDYRDASGTLTQLPRSTFTVDAQGNSLGNESRTDYDRFGRVTKAVSPSAWATGASSGRDSLTSPTTQTTYFDAASLPGSPAYTRTDTKTSPTTRLSTYTYFDGLGRVVQTKSQAKVNGPFVTVDQFYDAVGRNYASSNPYTTTSATYSLPPSGQARVTTEFDALGRSTKVTDQQGGTKQIYYSQIQVTSVDEVGRITQMEDWGNVRYQRTYSGTSLGVKPVQADYGQGLQGVYTTVTTTSSRGRTVIEDDKDNNPATLGNLIVTVSDLLGRKITYTDPDMGQWSYKYDANGALSTQTDAKGNLVTFAYNAAGQVSIKTGAASTTYTYGTAPNELGLVKSITQSGNSTTYTYDNLGRTTSVTRIIGAYGSRTETFTYDENGRLGTKTLPSGEKITYTYTAAGQTLGVSGDQPYQKSIETDDWGRLLSRSLGGVVNGVPLKTDFTYDPVTLRLTKFSTPGVSGYQFQYYADGNIRSKLDLIDPAYDETYYYDAQGRLDDARGAYSSFQDYTYDRLNNLTQLGSQINSYSDTRPHAISGDGTRSFGYDATGNMSVRGTSTLTYDTENRLTSVNEDGTKRVGYAYDDTRQRLTKSAGTKTTVYWFADYEEDFDATSTVAPATPTPYPDNPAGRVYRQDTWSTTDSWAPTAATVSVSGGALTFAQSVSGTKGYLTRSLSYEAAFGATMILRAKAGVATTLRIKANDVSAPNLALTTEWQTFKVDTSLFTGSITQVLLVLDNPGTVTIDWIYIGDGSSLPAGVDDLVNHPEGASYLQYNWQDYAGWANNGNSSTELRQSYLHVDSTVADPWIFKDQLAIEGMSNRILAVRLRQTAGSPGGTFQVFYRTDNHDWNANYRVDTKMPNTALNQWFTIALDMSNLRYGGADWATSTIRSLRLDPGTTAGQSFDIDWIYVGDGTSATTTAAKEYPTNSVGKYYLQDTWATKDSWDGIASAPGGGALRLTKTAAGQTANKVFGTAAIAGKTVMLKARRLSGSESLSLHLKATDNSILSSAIINLGPEWTTFSTVAPQNAGKITFSLNYDNANPTTCEIDYIYIGDGSRLPQNPESLPSAPWGASYLGIGWATQDNWVNGINSAPNSGSVTVTEGKLVADGFTYFDRFNVNYLPLAKGRVLALRGRVTRGADAAMKADLFGTPGWLRGKALGTLRREWTVLSVAITDSDATQISCLYPADYKTVSRRIELEWIYLGDGTTPEATLSGPSGSIVYSTNYFGNVDEWTGFVNPSTVSGAVIANGGNLVSTIPTDGGIRLLRAAPANSKIDAWVMSNVATTILVDNDTSSFSASLVGGVWTHIQGTLATSSTYIDFNYPSVACTLTMGSLYIGDGAVHPTTAAPNYPVNPKGTTYLKTDWGNLDNWYSPNFSASQTPVGLANGAMTSSQSSQLSTTFQKDGFALVASSTPVVKVSWHSTKPLNMVNCYFVSTSSGGLDETTRSSWPTNDRTSGVASFTMSNVPKWKDLVTTLRFDFNQGSPDGNQIWVDWIYAGDGTSVSNLVDYRSTILVDGTPIAEHSDNGVTYQLRDQLGSIVALVSPVGAVTRFHYEPFGKMMAPSGDGARFTGQDWDADADLYYYNARFYDPGLGRFIQPDTVLDGLNRYAYCGNDPVNRVDPSGNEWWNDWGDFRDMMTHNIIIPFYKGFDTFFSNGGSIGAITGASWGSSNGTARIWNGATINGQTVYSTEIAQAGIINDNSGSHAFLTSDLGAMYIDMSGGVVSATVESLAAGFSVSAGGSFSVQVWAGILSTHIGTDFYDWVTPFGGGGVNFSNMSAIVIPKSAGAARIFGFHGGAGFQNNRFEGEPGWDNWNYPSRDRADALMRRHDYEFYFQTVPDEYLRNARLVTGLNQLLTSPNYWERQKAYLASLYFGNFAPH